MARAKKLRERERERKIIVEFPLNNDDRFRSDMWLRDVHAHAHTHALAHALAHTHTFSHTFQGMNAHALSVASFYFSLSLFSLF